MVYVGIRSAQSVKICCHIFVVPRKGDRHERTLSTLVLKSTSAVRTPTPPAHNRPATTNDIRFVQDRGRQRRRRVGRVVVVVATTTTRAIVVEKTARRPSPSRRRAGRSPPVRPLPSLDVPDDDDERRDERIRLLARRGTGDQPAPRIPCQNQTAIVVVVVVLPGLQAAFPAGFARRGMDRQDQIQAPVFLPRAEGGGERERV